MKSKHEYTKDTLSIRSYTLTGKSHFHEFDQIVIPLCGSMTITISGKTYAASLGHCVVIPAGFVHDFSASEESRFLVADMDGLPENAVNLPDHCVTISPDLLAFCSYAEIQLTKQANSTVVDLLYKLFRQLIVQQDFTSRLDDRIMRAVTRIEQDLSLNYSIQDLAAIAFLSVSQFKSVFKKNMGMSCHEYLTKRRMEQAKTLLMNTDYPVSIIAMEVGYEDASAFSRRFRNYFGQSPKQFARRV